ncbi:MAG TPA: cyclic nucleotide-binding domain-containing protein [Streptosporangiaceae bacterium]|jgi:CRP-like cAMP-binding protein
MSVRPQRPPDDGLASLLGPAGDEAVLPAGSRLCDQGRPGHQCFVIIEGEAVVEQDGSRLRSLASGEFVGDFGPGGRPLPPSGVTVRLLISSRVLVLDSTRLATLIESEPALAAWCASMGRT